MEGDGSEVDFGLDMELDDEPADGEVKAFHPTDALLIGGNGPFNATNDDESIINFDQNEQFLQLNFITEINAYLLGYAFFFVLSRTSAIF